MTLYLCVITGNSFLFELLFFLDFFFPPFFSVANLFWGKTNMKYEVLHENYKWDYHSNVIQCLRKWCVLLACIHAQYSDWPDVQKRNRTAGWLIKSVESYEAQMHRSHPQSHLLSISLLLWSPPKMTVCVPANWYKKHYMKSTESGTKPI